MEEIIKNAIPMNFYLLLLADGAPKEFNFFGELVQLMLTLLVVLTLAFVTLYFVKRVMNNRTRGQNQGAMIKVLEKRMLHSKSSIYLIEVLGKGIVIAESPAGIQLLSEFAEGCDMEEMISSIKQEIKPAISLFPKKLRELLKGGAAK